MWKAYTEKNIPYLLRRAVSILFPDPNTQKYRVNSLNSEEAFVDQPNRKFKRLPACTRFQAVT